VRVNDFNMPRSLIIGIGTGVGGCTYTQSGVGVERVGEMGDSRGGKVRRWTDVPLHHPPFEDTVSRRVRITRRWPDLLW
jgi:hypothetical protein